MGFTTGMSKTTSRMQAKRADLRARVLDRQRRRLDHQVEDLKVELDREREARRQLAGMMSDMEGRSMRSRGTLRLLIVGGVAYVLGAKAGRGRYEEIMTKGREMRDRMRGAMATSDGSNGSSPLIDTVKPSDLTTSSSGTSSSSKRLATGTE
jgi:hypothetical protein